LLGPRVVPGWPVVLPFKPAAAGVASLPNAWSTWFSKAESGPAPLDRPWFPLARPWWFWAASGSLSWLDVEEVCPMFWGPRTPPSVTGWSFRVTVGALAMSVEVGAEPSLKMGDSQLSPFIASSLYSVALVEMPPARWMLGKMESCLVMAMLTFVFDAISSAFFWPCRTFFWKAETYLL